MSDINKQHDDLAAPLDAIVDRLLSQAEGMGLGHAVKVGSWVDRDGEPRVSVKSIPYDQLYVTYPPAMDNS